MALLKRIVTFPVKALMACGEKRALSGITRKAAGGLAIVIALYHLWSFTIGLTVAGYERYSHNAIHVASILALSFLTYSCFSKKSSRVPILDVFLALVPFVIMVYQITNTRHILYDRFVMSPQGLSTFEIAMGLALILLLMEAGRRIMSSFLPLLALVALIYAYLGPRFDGIFYHRGFNLSQIIDFTVFSFDGIYGIPIGISATYIILFVIFSSLVGVSGAAEFFSDLATALVGNTRGGPAKVAVVGSGLVGSISSSAVGNVALTGSVTIPMMKKVGFEPHFAGAVEAAASTGGHITPPVMMGSVFIMSEIIGVSYWSICLAAVIPAILYYVGIYLQVHFYSIEHGIGALKKEKGIDRQLLWRTIKRGWQHFLPFASIVALLAQGYSPIWAALWSMPLILIASWFHKDTRIGFKKLFNALETSVMTMRVIMVACALSGIVVGVIFYSGLGSSLIGLISTFLKESLLLALLLAAATCFLIGMVSVVTAAYLLTAILVVPATVKLGVPPLAAHMFAIYFASVASFTPPVGPTFYQAASMAGAEPMKTGFTAIRLGFASFVIPFFFVFNPALLLLGSPIEIVRAVIITTIGVVCLAAGLEGRVLIKATLLERALLIAGGVLLLFSMPLLAVGLAAIALTLLLQWNRARAKAKEKLSV